MNSLRAVLLLLHLTVTIVSSENDGDDDFNIDISSITDYVMVDSEQTNPELAHFFNGSYSAYDVMVELKNNRSLIQSQIDRSQSKGNNNCMYSRIYGGRGGSFFRDPCAGDYLGGIIIRASSLINSIRIFYSNSKYEDGLPLQHGGSGGRRNVAIFFEKETVVALVGSHGSSSLCGNCINELGFMTENKYGIMNIHGPYGRRSGKLLLLAGEIGGFYGRSGDYLDAIGSYYNN